MSKACQLGHYYNQCNTEPDSIHDIV